jgi:5-methyltetrahydropteroyltriglutamate--homocysteine methyltransferase
MNGVVDGAAGVRTGVHVCRGNSARNESALFSGTYRPLAPYFERLHVNQLILEYATYRAGDFVAFRGKEIGLGVVDPRVDRIETPDEIRRAVERALPMHTPESLFLNPDCGFSAVADRPLTAEFRALAKLQSIVEAARQLRARLAPVPVLQGVARLTVPADNG